MIEYSKGIRSLQSRIEAQVLLGVGVCVGENRSFKAFKPITKALKVLINRALGLKCFNSRYLCSRHTPPYVVGSREGRQR